MKIIAPQGVEKSYERERARRESQTQRSAADVNGGAAVVLVFMVRDISRARDSYFRRKKNVDYPVGRQMSKDYSQWLSRKNPAECPV